MVGTGTMIEGWLHRLFMVEGRHTPGHFSSFCLLGAGLGGLGALVVVFLIGELVVPVGGLLLVGAFVMQHLPLPGQIAFLSISSRSREKNPVTQVPRQRFSRGISNVGLFTGFSFFGFSCFTTCTAVVVSAASIISSSSSLDALSSLSPLLSLQRSSCFGMISSSGVASSSNIFFATQHLRLGLHRSSISKIASQKHEILSATQTPGQTPEGWKGELENQKMFFLL